jgi:hypothetical protein
VLLQSPKVGWQGSTGISGSIPPASVATFHWHQWQRSTGISGRIPSASVATFGRNTQPERFSRFSWDKTVERTIKALPA